MATDFQQIYGFASSDIGKIFFQERFMHNFACMVRFNAVWLLVLFLTSDFFSNFPGGKFHRFISEGNEAYRNGNFRQAEDQYRKALQEKNAAQAHYNLGNSLYRQGRFQEAAGNFRRAATAFSSSVWSACAWHNLGNTYFRQQKYADAIIAYKSALKIRPEDADTQRNLDIAMRILQSQHKSKPKPNVVIPKNGFGGQGDTLASANKPPSSTRNSVKKVAPLNKSEAEQLLKIAEREELKVQQRLRKQTTSPSSSEKDW